MMIMFKHICMTNKEKIARLIDMLKFALKTDDEDIINSTVESVIESLEELIANN